MSYSFPIPAKPYQKKQINTINNLVDDNMFDDDIESRDRSSSTSSSLAAGPVLMQGSPLTSSPSSPKQPAGQILTNFDPGKNFKQDREISFDEIIHKQGTMVFKTENATKGVQHFCSKWSEQTPVSKSKGDVVDAVASEDGAESYLQRAHPPEAQRLAQLEAEFKYNMSHPERGCFIIFNQKNFEPDLKLTVRNGTERDAMNLENSLKGLGFEYVRIVTDATRHEILSWIKMISEADHKSYDMFGCAILTHGGIGDKLYAKDAAMELTDFTRPFGADRCLSLAGKPKLFFIQACRGFKLDSGVPIQQISMTTDFVDGHCDYPSSDAVDGNPDLMMTIPAEADFLVANSTVQEYFSWRNESNGSIFIQALCGMLDKHGYSMEIMRIITRVNKVVSYEFESKSNDEFWNKKKQVPSIVTRLTHELFFTEKQRTSPSEEVQQVCVDSARSPSSPDNNQVFFQGESSRDCRRSSHATSPLVYSYPEKPRAQAAAPRATQPKVVYAKPMPPTSIPSTRYTSHQLRRWSNCPQSAPGIDLWSSRSFEPSPAQSHDRNSGSPHSGPVNIPYRQIRKVSAPTELTSHSADAVRSFHKSETAPNFSSTPGYCHRNSYALFQGDLSPNSLPHSYNLFTTRTTRTTRTFETDV